MKYKLINSVTKKETICDKVTIDGFDYYINNDKLIPNYYVFDPIGNRITKIHLVSKKGENFGAKKVIATTNPNIDIHKVVEAKVLKYKIAEHEYPAGKRERKHTEQEAFINGWNKCLQSQETHPFSEEDMIEFLDFYKMTARLDFNSTGENHGKTTQELLQIWREQKPKIVYYGND